MKGRTLKRARKALGMTQLQLAHELDTTRNTVERWERNVHKIPSLVARYITQKMDGKD